MRKNRGLYCIEPRGCITVYIGGTRLGGQEQEVSLRYFLYYEHPPGVVEVATRTIRLENNGDIPRSRNAGVNVSTRVEISEYLMQMIAP